MDNSPDTIKDTERLIVKEEEFLSYIRERFQIADPTAKREFEDKFVGGVDFDVSPTPTPNPTQEQEQSYFIAEDSKECGITKEEYEFLLSDIEQGIRDGNRKYGFGEPGYIDADGNFYPFSDNDKPRDFARAIPKVDPMPPRQRRRRRRIEIEEPGPLLEEVMLARGMLHAVVKGKRGDR